MSVLKMKQDGKWLPVGVGGQGPAGKDGINGFEPQIYVYAAENVSVTVTDPSGEVLKLLKEEDGALVYAAKQYGVHEISAVSQSGLSRTQTLVVEDVRKYVMFASMASVYGVQWDGTADSRMSRIGDGDVLMEPVPYNGSMVSGELCSSPFDDIMPWAGVEEVDDPVCGRLVKIPKYYYKWTKTGNQMTLEISSEMQTDFYVSPAHADRGDGYGERDFVYVGKYHCNSAYKSVSKTLPQVSNTIDAFRAGVHALGSDVWQYDFAMYWTIMMLYLVEYADWDSQKILGRGCSAAGGAFAVGATDDIPYHTGTPASMDGDRPAYGSVKYRHIEGLWDNVYDWVDGLFAKYGSIYAVNNPAYFGKTAEYALVGGGTINTGCYVTGWTIPNLKIYRYALLPIAGSSTSECYVCDVVFCSNSARETPVRVGGDASQKPNRGAFLINYDGTTSGSNIGGRLMVLPNE